MPGHIALVGDSVFDNRRYVATGQDVASHLRTVIPPDWAVTLLARDGSPAYQVGGQLAGLPPQATHLVVSAGGNDLLMLARFLPARATSPLEVARTLGDKVKEFEWEYRHAIEPVLKLGPEVVLCTIYNGNFPAPQAAFARVLVALFDDAILRFAFERRLSVIDLRAVCTEPTDFANSLEPSSAGGLKVAQMVSKAVGATQGAHARIYVP